MAIHIAGVALPGPADVLDTVRSVTGWGAETTALLAGLPRRAEALLADVELLLRRISDVTDRAEALVARVDAVATRATPLASRFVEELTEQEVVAAVRLVDQLPALAEHMETDIMPILATLDRVGPDIHELLDVVKDLREALDTVPGLGRLRRRISPPVPED